MAPDGSDDNDGTSLESPLASLHCLLDRDACADMVTTAEPGDVICLLAGIYQIDEPIFVRVAPESIITIMALGDDHSAILDGACGLQENVEVRSNRHAARLTSCSCCSVLHRPQRHSNYQWPSNLGQIPRHRLCQCSRLKWRRFVS